MITSNISKEAETWRDSHCKRGKDADIGYERECFKIQFKNSIS